MQGKGFEQINISKNLPKKGSMPLQYFVDFKKPEGKH